MQMHHHRAEHWVILAGTGGDGQWQAVPADREPVHLYSDWRRAQPGKPGRIPLEVLEIQSGSYLGEDDIIRIKDQYGRC
ncbi:hypothetical protein [Klebsiella pneumoniae]|uniref:hypothetical protein n=1 Tax=Klebsiella pneumoniae TaxID=573 RepID=UPI0022CE2F1C|nr:hypothetical protein [Klebsiella pneumoniae]